MSYISDEIRMAQAAFKRAEPDTSAFVYGAFLQGLLTGFKIAILAYGVWKSGTQVIGCQEERVQDIIKRELGGAL